MKKRILCVLLALLMLVVLATPAMAAVTHTEAAFTFHRDRNGPSNNFASGQHMHFVATASVD